MTDFGLDMAEGCGVGSIASSNSVRGKKMVRAVHQIKGRARFSVSGLRGSRALALHLERELARRRGVLRASASKATGNVLVLFAEGLTLEALVALIGEIRSGFEGTAGGIVAGLSTDGVRSRFARKNGGPVWHALTVEDVVKRLECLPDGGLSEASVISRRERFGPNALPSAPTRSFTDILKGHALSRPLILIGVTAGFTALTGRVVEGALALGVAVANTVIGFVIEARAEHILKTVSEAVDLRARVMREGRIEEIPFEEVVPGDVLDLQAGSRVPADARLVVAEFLAVDESALTGESTPVAKSPMSILPPNASVRERVNMVYKGTLVVEGGGRAVTVAIGSDTVLGRLQGFLGEVYPPEALMVRDLRRIATHLLSLGVGASGVYAVAALLRGKGIVDTVGGSLSFLAGSIPSGLSTLAVSSFAFGHLAMRKRRIVARRLRVLGSLASVKVVCFDKTGTLTLNRMTVTETSAGGKHMRVDAGSFTTHAGAVEVLDDPDAKLLIELCVLCNTITLAENHTQQSLEGSSTERALIRLAEEAGINPKALQEGRPLVHIEPRMEDRPFMTTRHRWSPSEDLVAMKGNPVEVLERCTHVLVDGRCAPMDEETRDGIRTENFRMAGMGLRVLGVACRMVDAGAPGSVMTTVDEGDWPKSGEPGEDGASAPNGAGASDPVWVGLVAMADPVRKEAGPLIESLHRAGVRTVVITGDQNLTAQSIGESLRMSGGGPLVTLDASDIQGLGDSGMRSLVTNAHVFARLSPTQKVRVIQAYQGAGLSVAMVGDGVNDALALKVADVGIAMGKDGAELARKSADLVLEDDNLESVMVALTSGRGFFQNMRRSLRFLLTANYLDLVVGLSDSVGVIGDGLSVWQGLWTNCICLSLAAGPVGEGLAEVERLPVSETDFLRESDARDSLTDAGGLLAGALAVGAYAASTHGVGEDAGRLFIRSAAVNQLMYGLICREKGGELETRSTRGVLDAVLAAVVGGHLVAALAPGVGASPDVLALHALDVVALLSGGFFSRRLLCADETPAPPMETAGEPF
jgi:Ca2+-transporting ATPase